MNETNSDFDPRVEAVFQQFERALRQAREPAEVLREFCRDYPELNDDLREVADLVHLLGATQIFESDGGPATGPITSDPQELGPYKVLRRIGLGGMGVVYEAVEDTLGRHVAVKTIRPGRTPSASMLLRFDRERKLLARMHHTNIVPILATGKAGDLLYFAMPYIGGASLGQVISTARAHGANGGFPSSSTFEDLVKDAHSKVDADKSLKGDQNNTVHECKIQGEPIRALVTRPLPRTCVRTAVQVIAAVAEALHYAHEAGIVHRDLKPSNIMVDPNCHPWVLDFGLSRLRPESHQKRSGVRGEPIQEPTGDDGAHWPEHLTSLTFLGTQLYAAPEQHRNPKNADARSDVWSLGVTIYELITLHHPFTRPEQIVDAKHVISRPREHDANISRDLEAIVLKTLNRDPAHRYQNALVLSEDLRHWLRGEPVTSRPAWPLRRTWLWSKRNKGMAIGLVAFLLGILSLGVGGLLAAKAAIESKRHTEQQYKLFTMQQKRLGTHGVGWAKESLNDLGVFLKTVRLDDTDTRRLVQQEAVACLSDFDVESGWSTKDYGAYYLAFDERNRLLMGGVFSKNDRWVPNQGARLYDPSIASGPEDLTVVGMGPVGFAEDHRPIQLLLADDAKSVTLTNLRSRQPIRRWELSGGLKRDDHADVVPPLAMTPEGHLVAATVQHDHQGQPQPTVMIWDGTTGELRLSVSFAATSIAFAPDGSLLAVGDGSGNIEVWSLDDVKCVTKVQLDRHRINAIAFGRNARLEHRAGELLPPRRRWQLAAGDTGAAIKVWDLGAQPAILRSECRGSSHEVFSLAFSADGSTLVSSARGGARLWDPATGAKPLLFVGAISYSEGLAISPDGSMLALSGFDETSKATISSTLKLFNGRGIRGLYGLSHRVEKAWFSPDDRHLVALSQGWELGVWDRDSGRQLLILDAPAGIYADNAGVAISPDGTRLAFFSHKQGMMWNLTTGEIVREWSGFNPGLQDCLSFRGAEELLLARRETLHGEPPTSDFPSAQYHQVCRMYNLLGAEPKKAIHEFTDPNLGIKRVALAPKGDYLLLDVLDGSEGKSQRLTRLFDVTGTQASLFRQTILPDAFLYSDSSSLFDPTGHVAMFGILAPSQYTLLDIRDPQSTRVVPRLGKIGPHGKTWTAGIHINGTGNGTGIYELGRIEPLFTLSTENSPSSLGAFSREGAHITGFDNQAAEFREHFSVLDLVQIRAHLNRLGLGW